MAHKDEALVATEETQEPEFTSIEICAGAGGQALGLHQAGFGHLALVEFDPYAVATLRKNVAERKSWAWERRHCDLLPPTDVRKFAPSKQLVRSGVLLEERGLDLLAGGVPCPPFSRAGKQLGRDDERDLFPRMLELVGELNPRAVMIENVRGIMDRKFSDYRSWIVSELERQGYGSGARPGYTVCKWDLLEASDFGVPQLRPRAVLVAIRNDILEGIDYQWPVATHVKPVSVAKSLGPSMFERYKPYFEGEYAAQAQECYARWLDKDGTRAEKIKELRIQFSGIAPTLVGGSKKHGGADLGPSRAKAAWKWLGISGMGVANDIKTCREKGTEERDLFGPDGPMLTVRQAALIQGFPSEWAFSGGKTAQYRQVGNAFPPPVAKAVGESIAKVLRAARERDQVKSDQLLVSVA
ncbi:DNA cytosine methyltransferase [Streptomyces sp. NPDC057144]|uniref:DNA cytosine methyltransferase n=1 Tax=Streptomyces sp. NPDC057144 TaxID=3346034 RepID=UPI00363F3906